jgi:AcrR family transcriptional regulator
VLGETDRAPRAFSDYRLPPGRHGISPAEVAENQRWRLLGAAAEVLAEQGHVNTTSTRVSRAAGVSPATFYRHYDDIGACLLASYEAAAGCVWEIVSDACAEEGLGWLHRLGVAVASALRFLAVEPATAHLLGAEPPAGERAIANARRASIERLAGLLASGRDLRPAEAGELPAGTECHLVTGAVAIFAERVAAGEVERLPELGPMLTEMLAAPYVS